MPPAGPAHGPFPPIGVHVVGDDPALPGPLQRGRLGVAQNPGVAINERVDVGIDGIHGRHDEDPRAAAAHLVHVQPDLGEPLLVEDLPDEARFDLGEHVSVAVVVVAGVGMIQPGQRGILIRRSQGLVVPIGDHDFAVGIQAGHEQEDDVVQDLVDLRRFVHRQLVNGLRGHLGGPHFRGVHAAGYQEEELALADQRSALLLGRNKARIEDAPVDLLERFDIPQIGRRGDDQEKERITVGRLAQLLDENPVGFLAHQAEIIHHFVPADHLHVRADLMAEKRFRRGDRLSRQDGAG